MRPEKEAIIKEVSGRLEASEYVILADCRGMDVTDISKLRSQLADQHSRLYVVKNSFFGRAASGLGWNGMGTMLEGPSAMITGDGDVTEVAKLLRTFVKQRKTPVIKGGRFGAQVLSTEDVDELARIPPREVLYAMVAGTLAAPMTQLVGVMNQKLLSLIYVLKAAAEKKQAS